MHHLLKKHFTEIVESMRIAMASLAANKMRAALTMLGIIIGVAAVITMVGLGNGAQKAIADRIQALGSNLLFIRPGSSSSGRVHYGAGCRLTLKNADADALAEKCKTAQLVVPEFDSNAQVQFEANNWNCEIVGTTPEYQEARDFPTSEGRYFTYEEMANSERIAVIGSDVRDNLFESVDPIGKAIRIKQQDFIVVGLLIKKGQVGWRNQDDQIIIPLTTAQKRVFGTDYLTGITVKVLNGQLMNQTFLQVEKLLRRQHRLLRNQDNDFTIRNQADIISTFQETNKTFGLLLAFIAGVSLFVGGIGIMNIMLVSVTERTREIGIRKALGARKKDILLQFLIESITLSLSGGIIGILMGISLSYVLSTWANWNTMVSLISIILSFGFATLVGLFFGIYPARKASLLDPIIALRYE